MWSGLNIKAKITAWCHLKGIVTRIMHAKCECFIINISEDMRQVKFLWHIDRWTDKWVLMSPSFRKNAGDNNQAEIPSIRYMYIQVHVNVHSIQVHIHRLNDVVPWSLLICLLFLPKGSKWSHWIIQPRIYTTSLNEMKTFHWPFYFIPVIISRCILVRISVKGRFKTQGLKTGNIHAINIVFQG